jgi:hypothetical protein
MSLSRITALIIQKEDIRTKPIESGGQWGGILSYYKDGKPHVDPLVVVEPIYNSQAEAETYMRSLIARVRSMTLYPGLKGITDDGRRDSDS